MAKVTVTMKRTMKGSEDGIVVKEFEGGRTYAMEEDLAKVFVDNDWGKLSSGRVKVEKPEGDETPDPDKKTEPEGNDSDDAPLLEQKPSKWVGKVVYNPEGEARTVQKVNGNQVFFAEEDQSYDYRNIRNNFTEKPKE